MEKIAIYGNFIQSRFTLLCMNEFDLSLKHILCHIYTHVVWNHIYDILKVHIKCNGIEMVNLNVKAIYFDIAHPIHNKTPTPIYIYAVEKVKYQF